ncbi:haloalkane dehalogenase [Gracilaria domingensis]|nr:haloalkane dehalogenase [Gracilaria domingensis]
MPHLEGRGSLIAPDLIGGGFRQTQFQRPQPLHYRAALQLPVPASRITRRQTERYAGDPRLGFGARAIVFLESLVIPLRTEFFSSDVVNFFSLLRSPAGEELVLNQNVFVEQGLPDGVLRQLTTKEMEEYRRPFLNAGEDRRPTLTFPRQIPIDGFPADVAVLIESYSQWLRTSSIPKLLIKREPGVLITNGSLALQVIRSWPALTEVSVPGIHYLQEDSSDLIGVTIANWLPA